MGKTTFKIHKSDAERLLKAVQRAEEFQSKFKFMNNIGNFRKKLGLTPITSKVTLKASKTSSSRINSKFNNLNKPIVQRIVGASVGLYHGSTYDAIEKALTSKGKKTYTLTKIKKHDANYKKALPKGNTITRVISFRGTLSYGAFKFKRKYRDPKLATPYNFHWGAASKFKRFGIVQLVLPGGKKAASGYKRSGAPFYGLGHEPIGVRPKASAKNNQYKVFRRKFYPGRGNPDTLVTGLGLRAYNYIYEESKVGEKIHRKIDTDIDKMVKSICKSIVRTTNDSFKRR